MTMINITIAVTYFGFLLGTGILIASVFKKQRIPDAFFLLLTGLLLGPTVLSNPLLFPNVRVTLVDVNAMGTVPDFLRTLALILIVFIGTFNLRFKLFKRLSGISINLSFIGVVFSTVVMGVAAHFLLSLEWVYAFLLSSILSGTDTSILHTFDTLLSKSKKAASILKVESIFNSPLSVLIPVLLMDLIYLHSDTLLMPLRYLSQFWLMVAGGVGTGLIVGLITFKLLNRVLREYRPLLLLSIALISFALAENIGGSGMLSVAVCGLVAGNTISKGKDEIEVFEDQFSELLRISVFILLGAQVALSFSLLDIELISLFFVIMFVTRPLFVMPLIKKFKISTTRTDTLLMSFVSPRGLSAAAMAPVIGLALMNRGGGMIADKIINIVFIVIFLSVLFSTISAWLISRHVNEKDHDEEKEDVVVNIQRPEETGD